MQSRRLISTCLFPSRLIALRYRKRDSVLIVRGRTFLCSFSFFNWSILMNLLIRKSTIGFTKLDNAANDNCSPPNSESSRARVVENRLAYRLKLAYSREFFGAQGMLPFIRTRLPRIVVSHGVGVNSSSGPREAVRPRPDKTFPRYSARVSCKRDSDREA